MGPLKKFWDWTPAAPTPEELGQFPPEAFDYGEPLTKEAIADLQREADKTLKTKKWVVIERIGVDDKR